MNIKSKDCSIGKNEERNKRRNQMTNGRLEGRKDE